MRVTVCLLSVLYAASSAYPVSQPLYPPTQYIQQSLNNLQYRAQPQFIAAQPQPAYLTSGAVPQQTTAKPVYETPGLQKYSTQIKQRIQQVLVPTNVDRQVQRAAQSAGPLYYQQIQAAQQQGQFQQVLDSAQRKATSQSLARPVQQVLSYPTAVPVPQPQFHPQPQHQPPPPPQPQPHYVRALAQQNQIKYAPAGHGYRQAQAQNEQDAKQNPEEYDANPSYQFGFDVNDDLYTNYQNRKEQREGNKITGSYSVVDSDGFVRTVTYTADPKEGFKAEVTRQPTDIVVKIPKPDPRFQAQVQHQQQGGQKEQEAQRGNVLQYQYQ